jgi:hypothetical protein
MTYTGIFTGVFGHLGADGYSLALYIAIKGLRGEDRAFTLSTA